MLHMFHTFHMYRPTQRAWAGISVSSVTAGPHRPPCHHPYAEREGWTARCSDGFCRSRGLSTSLTVDAWTTVRSPKRLQDSAMTNRSTLTLAHGLRVLDKTHRVWLVWFTRELKLQTRISQAGDLGTQSSCNRLPVPASHVILGCQQDIDYISWLVRSSSQRWVPGEAKTTKSSLRAAVSNGRATQGFTWRALLALRPCYLRSVLGSLLTAHVLSVSTHGK